MTAVPKPDPAEQMGCLEAMCIVERISEGDALDKWLLMAVADCGTLDPKTLAAYTLIPERDVATRLLRLQFETEHLDRIRARWEG